MAKGEGWQKVNQRIQKSERRKKLLHILSSAAAIILPIFIAGSAFYFTTHSEIPIPAEAYACMTIEPGQAKAILTLDDGKVLNITGHTQQSSMDDLFMQQDSATINFQAVSPQLMAETMKYNKVEIPRGGEYKLILSGVANEKWCNFILVLTSSLLQQWRNGAESVDSEFN